MGKALTIGSTVTVRHGASEWLFLNRDGRTGRVIEHSAALVLVNFKPGDSAYFKPGDLDVR
jgi:hypothetical protein